MRPDRDIPHLLEWRTPLVRASRRALRDEVPWPIGLDGWDLEGRVGDRGGPPSGSIATDGVAAPCTSTTPVSRTGSSATPARGLSGQFRATHIRLAVWHAGLPTVSDPVWFVSTP
jgi:hypothetical protein